MIDVLDDIQKDLKSKLTRDRLQEAEEKVLKKMDEVKNRESQKGKSPAKGGRWNNIYNAQYAKREKGGRRSPVTLRNKKERIEQTRIEEGKRGSTLRFNDRKAGEIFFYHDSGTAKGGKFRQVYPDNDRQVPEVLDQIAEHAVFKILDE